MKVYVLLGETWDADCSESEIISVFRNNRDAELRLSFLSGYEDLRYVFRHEDWMASHPLKRSYANYRIQEHELL
jgi:hypothetical protein